MVLIFVLSLFHNSLIIISKSEKFDLKKKLQQRLVTFHVSGGFLQYVF